MDNKPAPDEILELVTCNCKNSKCVSVYSLKCLTDICDCKNDSENSTEDENDFFSDEEVMSNSSDKFEYEITEDDC